MATEITMPKLSDTMTEGRLVSWKKNVGDRVERGEIIAEVETDKATMELEAFSSGTLLEIRVKPGDMAPVGTVMALVGETGEKADNPPPPVKPVEEAPAPPSATAESPAPPDAIREPPPATAEPDDMPERSGELPVRETDTDRAPPAEPDAGEKASPLVRRLAREQGIDLRQVKGSGPEERILQEDLEKAGTRDAGLRPQKGYGPQAGIGTGEDQKTASGAETAGGAQPLSRMRGAIARTVSEAWHTIPHFFVTVDIDMEEAERVRRELKSAGTTVSLNDFIIKASAAAIGKFPRVNASFSAEGITLHSGINIGIAVALDEGLLVPVIKGCGGRTLKEIATSSRDLIARAKEGKLGAADIAGGTFSISNLGMYGIDEFTAIIHPSQGAVLAVGAVSDRPVIREGHLAAARLMRATLSADHRLIDGAYAAKFLRELKRVLENPVTMLL